MTNAKVPADDEARRRALDPAGSFIVQAPAGSGKTELLIRRFLVLLGRVAEPEQVVAITFTRKSAAEMRERILQAMDDARDSVPGEDSDIELRRIARTAWLNNERRGWQLERHPSRLRVQTIDALCSALTRRMPWLSRFGSPLKVVDDAEELYRTAAADTLTLLAGDDRQWRTTVAELLIHLDNEVQHATDLLTDTLRFRDQWLRCLGGTMALDERRVRMLLEAAWSEAVRLELLRVGDAVPEAAKAEIAACAAYAAGELAPTSPHSPIVSWRGRRDFAGVDAEALPLWRGLRALLLTAEGGWRRRLDIKVGFPGGAPAAERMKQRMRTLLATLSEDDAFQAALRRIDRLPDPAYQEKQWRVLSALMRLLPLAAARLNLLFGETGRVDFSEIAMRANQALGSLDAPSELALRLDCEISHLLVDEFQDTSVTQYRLLEHLTAGWTEGDGRTLFLVGDPMQSIYRFREAEVGLFLKVKADGLGALRLKPLTLTVNFRSDRRVLKWVNRTFSACFPRESDAARGAVVFNRSESFVPDGPWAGVWVHAFSDPGKDEEARRVVEIVQQTRRRDRGGTIAILARTRPQLRRILHQLDAAGVPYAGLDIQGLTWRPVVRDLLSLTYALSFPADRLSWLSVLRAPWCGLELPELHLLANAERCIWDAIRDRNVTALLPAEAQRRLKRFAGPVGHALMERGRVSLRRQVENTWISLGGPACVEQAELDNARLFFDLLEDFQHREGALDLTELSKAAEQRWARTPDPDDVGIQVMTLHKAKGLEFDTVIIPGLERRSRPGDPRLVLWEEQMHGPQPGLLLAPLSEAGGTADPHYSYLSALYREKDDFETARLLYVGCTRARRCLHLLGSVTTTRNNGLRKPHPQTMLATLWPQLEPYFERARGRQLDLFAGGHPTDTDAPVLRRLPRGWEPPPLPAACEGTTQTRARLFEDAVEYAWAGDIARQVGIIVHDMLALIGEDGFAGWDDRRLAALDPVWRTDLVRQGVDHQAAKEASRRIRGALGNVLADNRARWLLSSEHEDAHTEHGVSLLLGGGVRRYRIDRTFVDGDGVRWIVDFKSSTHQGGGLDEFLDRERQRYRRQLEDYARAVRTLEHRPIRLGLYFPMLKGWREWAFEE